MKIIKVNHKKPNSITSKGEKFLCKSDFGTIFVSSLYFTEKPDHSLPQNSENGCLYVDCSSQRMAIPVDKLKEMYKIIN